VSWIRDTVQCSQLSAHEVVQKLQKVASLLNSVYQLTSASGRTDLEKKIADKSSPVVSQIIERIGVVSLDVFSAKTTIPEPCSTVGPCSMDAWKVPGSLSIEKLLELVEKEHPVSADLRGVHNSFVRVLTRSSDEKKWLASVACSWELKDKNEKDSTRLFYAWDGTWKRMKEEAEVFAAIASLPRELKMWSMLLGPAKIWRSLPLHSLKKTFEDALAMGYISRDEELTYFEAMIEKSVQIKMKDGSAFEFSKAEIRDYVIKESLPFLEFLPQDVMAIMEEMNIMGSHPLWSKKPRTVSSK